MEAELRAKPTAEHIAWIEEERKDVYFKSKFDDDEDQDRKNARSHSVEEESKTPLVEPVAGNQDIDKDLTQKGVVTQK